MPSGCSVDKRVVRFLLVNNHCISDPTAGVTQSLRTIVEWLHDAGHDCRVLTTARFEAPVIFTIEDHLTQQGVDRSLLVTQPRRTKGQWKKLGGSDRPVVHYSVKGVPVTLLVTRHNDESRPDRAEGSQYLALLKWDGKLPQSTNGSVPFLNLVAR